MTKFSTTGDGVRRHVIQARFYENKKEKHLLKSQVPPAITPLVDNMNKYFTILQKNDQIFNHR